jgi:hypothetical protein
VITFGDEVAGLAHSGFYGRVINFVCWGAGRLCLVPGPDPTVEVVMSEPTIERSTTSVALPVEELFSNDERSALVGFLAGYSGQTRAAYTLDLRQYTSWCATHGLHLFAAKRADIECYARDLEARGRARATIARRLCTVARFYRYAVEEDLLDHSPAAHVRRPDPAGANFHPALVRGDDRPADGEPDPGAADPVARRVRPVEALEDVRKMFGRDPLAAVRDRDLDCVTTCLSADADLATRWGVAKGVVEQVRQDLGQPLAIGVDPRGGTGIHHKARRAA